MRNDTEGCAELSLTGFVLCGRSVTAESKARFQASPFRFCGGPSGIGTRFSHVTAIPPLLHTHSLVTDTVTSNLDTTLLVSTTT
jgi:hypothetical protein